MHQPTVKEYRSLQPGRPGLKGQQETAASVTRMNTTIKTCCRKFSAWNGSLTSSSSMSLENRFMSLPVGIVSKKLMGLCTICEQSESQRPRCVFSTPWAWADERRQGLPSFRAPTRFATIPGRWSPRMTVNVRDPASICSFPLNLGCILGPSGGGKDFVPQGNNKPRSTVSVCP